MPYGLGETGEKEGGKKVEVAVHFSAKDSPWWNVTASVASGILTDLLSNLPGALVPATM